MTTIPRTHLTQHPDPEAPQRLHLTEHVDPAGVEEACVVFLDPEDENGPASICIDFKVDLGAAQAREVSARLIALAELLDPTPANPAVLGAVEGVAREHGITLAELATVAGVDLESITATDLTKLGMTLTYWEERLAEHLLRVIESSSD